MNPALLAIWARIRPTDSPALVAMGILVSLALLIVCFWPRKD
jgi:type II secretory pathway component PulM